MEGSPGRRLSAPRRAGVPWKLSDVWTVSARCCTRCLHTQRLSGRFSTPTGVLGVPGPDAPLWTIDLLVDDNDRDLGRQPIGIRLEDGAVVELGQNGAGA